MKFCVLTIFPEMFDPFRETGIVRLALEREIVSLSAVNIRDFTHDRHKSTDDRPYGGGCGMVMKPEPLAAAIRAAKAGMPGARTILMTPQGRPFHQRVAEELAQDEGLVFVCGRYEGIDERICQNLVDDEISIGDYILTGGELAVMVIMDAVTRLIPGALGGDESAALDSFSGNLLEHAHYTRPRVFEGDEVPDVLLSGHHAEIEKWRLETSLVRTFLKRPDLLRDRNLSRAEVNILKKWCSEIESIIHAQSLSGAHPSSGRQ